MFKCEYLNRLSNKYQIPFDCIHQGWQIMKSAAFVVRVCCLLFVSFSAFAWLVIIYLHRYLPPSGFVTVQSLNHSLVMLLSSETAGGPPVMHRAPFLSLATYGFYCIYHYCMSFTMCLPVLYSEWLQSCMLLFPPVGSVFIPHPLWDAAAVFLPTGCFQLLTPVLHSLCLWCIVYTYCVPAYLI